MIRLGPIHIPAPTPRLTALLMCALVVAVVVVTWRGELTRDQVERVDSACARASSIYATDHDVAECARIRREADRARSLRDSCIIQRKTLKSRWYQVITRCPPLEQRDVTPPLEPGN